MIRIQSLAAAALAALLVGCTTGAESPPAAAAPPIVAGVAPHAMVAAANPMAVDAAVAVQAVLGLVEPQSSGLGGGAFMTYYDAKTRSVTAYDGRETAPMGATPDMFLGPDGRPMPRGAAILSGRSTGAPGAVAMLAMAHADHGKRPWNSLFGEAERLADQGFVVPRRMGEAANSRAPQAQAPDAVRYFTKADGTKIRPGDTFRNPAYAATVRKIAAEGPRAILEGSIAEAIVARLHEAPTPGTMTLADLKAYRPKKGPALCRP